MNYKFTPDVDALKPLVDSVVASLDAAGHTDHVAAVIANMKTNAQLQAAKGIDQWLSYGVYLPAVEYVISQNSGEDEQSFFQRTQYPINIVEAYRVPGNDLATLVAADEYSTHHKRTMLKNTAEWCLNDDEQLFINLLEYENRLKA